MTNSPLNTNGIHPLFQQYIQQTTTHYLLNLPSLNQSKLAYKLLPYAEGEVGDQYMLLHPQHNHFNETVLVKRILTNNPNAHARISNLMKEMNLYQMISQSKSRNSINILKLTELGIIDCDSLDPSLRIDKKGDFIKDIPNNIPIDEEWKYFNKEIWYITPFCPFDLSQLIAHVHSNHRNGFPQDILALVAIQVLKGIDYLHNLLIVHRDIRPENIFISYNGIIKIGEFCESVQLESTDASSPVNELSEIMSATSMSSTATTTSPTSPISKNYSNCLGSLKKRHSMIGLVFYMSPEIIKGIPYQFSVDMWSFGVLIHECITGKPLFHNESPKDVIDALKSLDSSPPLPLEYKPLTTSLCRDFRKRCLVVDETRRATAKRMLTHRFLGQHGTIHDLQVILEEMEDPLVDMRRDYNKEYGKNRKSSILGMKFKRGSKMHRISRFG
eukprot:NODE_585_length_5683_cov_0.592586.p1 type:complete len:443 gc:universal NODE_585_length_5683_cov_0.592586:1580-252(-)